MPNFIFKECEEKDLELMHRWFQEPEIKRWYARGKSWSFLEITDKYLPQFSGQKNVPSFIIYLDELPVGFIQYYLLVDSLPEGVYGYDHPLFKRFPASELAGIDLFIAEQKFRGIGLGRKIIDAFISEHLSKFKGVVVDPSSDNHQAIACYEKSGFVKTDLSVSESFLILLHQRQYTLSRNTCHYPP